MKRFTCVIAFLAVCVLGPAAQAAMSWSVSPSGAIDDSQLSTTGVTAGSYTCASLTVTAAGRLSAASSGSCSGGGGTTVYPPGGRVTLYSGYPVQTMDLLGMTWLYYVVADGRMPYVSVPNGVFFTSYMIPVGGWNVAISASNVIAGGANDVLLTISSGNVVMCVSPSWSTGTRSGVTVTHGSMNLHNQYGLWTNASTLSHCYGGSAGTTDYGPINTDNAVVVATILGSANGQVSMMMNPAPATGGTNNYCGVVNYYNRVMTHCIDRDAVDSWQSQSSSPSNPVVCDAANSTTGLNRINFVDPLGDQHWVVRADTSVSASGSGYWGLFGIGIDTTAGASGTGGTGAYVQQVAAGASGNWGAGVHGEYSPNSQPAIGVHYAQCIEYANDGAYFNGVDYFRLELDMMM